MVVIAGKNKTQGGNQQFLQAVTIPYLMFLCRDYTLERDPPFLRYIPRLAGNDAVIYYPAWQNGISIVSFVSCLVSICSK